MVFRNKKNTEIRTDFRFFGLKNEYKIKIDLHVRFFGCKLNFCNQKN